MCKDMGLHWTLRQALPVLEVTIKPKTCDIMVHMIWKPAKAFSMRKETQLQDVMATTMMLPLSYAYPMRFRIWTR